MFFDDSQRFLELQSFPQELFEESPTAFQLAANSIIISQHDGYQFIYMTVDNLNVDPPIHFYMEGWEQAKLINMNFAEFMLDLIRAYEK